MVLVKLTPGVGVLHGGSGGEEWNVGDDNDVIFVRRFFRKKLKLFQHSVTHRRGITGSKKNSKLIIRSAFFRTSTLYTKGSFIIDVTVQGEGVKDFVTKVEKPK